MIYKGNNQADVNRLGLSQQLVLGEPCQVCRWTTYRKHAVGGALIYFSLFFKKADTCGIPHHLEELFASK